MGLSAPWADSNDIISLQTVKYLPWVNPMGLSVPMADSLDIIYLQTDKLTNKD